MKNISNIICLIIISSTIAMAQRSLKKANKAYEQLEYHSAIEHFEKYLENKNDNTSSLRLADCYYKTNQYELAENQYAQSQISNGDEAQINYARTLQLNSKIDQAKSIIEQFLKVKNDDPLGLIILQSCNRYDELMSRKNNYSIYQNDFVTGTSNFSPIYFGDQLLFTTDKGSKVDKWTGRSYSNLFIHDPATGSSTAIPGDINGKFHNGAAAMIDESTIIYTRNSKKKNKNNDYNLVLAIAKKNGKEWNFEKYFDYNNEDYNTAYPTISPDGQTLIFSSDRPGGQGGMDLYYCEWINNNWSAPKALSKGNTVGNEMFPYWSNNDNNIYFASDGYPGLGGLDIIEGHYYKGQLQQLNNMGAPFNSNRDDFGLISNDGLQSGYFCSNRNDNQGWDHIYSFEKNNEAITISGIVLDEYTRIPLKETTVSLEDSKTGEQFTFTTGTDGRFNFEIMSNAPYHLKGTKNDIATTEADVLVTDPNDSDSQYFTLLHNDPRFSLEGYTQNANDQSGVQGVTVNRYNSSSHNNIAELSNNDGFFKFQLEQNSDFEISGEKDGHYTSVSTASTKGLDRSKTLYVKLFLTMEEVVIGETKIIGKDDIGGWTFDPIYYDLDKDNIRYDASLVLDKLADFLQQNPTLIIELGSHTDSRGKDAYNQDLSTRRAASAVRYLIQKGVSDSRLQSRGYGETRLVNGCSNGINCNEYEHQMNRRTEIKVVGMN